MSEISIFSEIVTHQIQGVMLHDDLANMFDFMALSGFKCMQEYQAKCEFSKMRETNHYAINHMNTMLESRSTTRAKDIVPSSWRNATRFDVGENDRKSKVKELFMKWREWEKETKAFYQKKFKELHDMGLIASAEFVEELLEDVDHELNRIEKKILCYSSVGWDSVFILEQQSELKHKYKEKMYK